MQFSELSKIFNAVTNMRFNIDDSVKVYGLEFMKLKMPMGTLLLKIHPLLSRHTLYKKSMFIVDFDALHYVSLRNRDTKAKDDVQTKDEDVRRGFLADGMLTGVGLWWVDVCLPRQH